MKVRDTIFPFESAKRVGKRPVLFVALRKNQSTLDYIQGDKVQEEALEIEKAEQEK